MAEKQVTCPNGCKSLCSPEISDDPTVSRYRCGNLDCLRNFSVPRSGFGPSPIQLGRDEDREEASVAKLGECSKGCGRTDFKSGQAKGQHQRFCKGRAAAEKAPRATRSKRQAPREAAAVPTASTPGFIGGVLQILRDKREELVYLHEQDLKSIDGAISALEGRS